MDTLGRTRKAKQRKLKPGDRVKISQGSGLDSGKTGTLLAWDAKEAQAIAQDYPFVRGRTPQSMKWLAVKLDAGGITAMPAERVLPIGEGLVFPPFPPSLL